MRSPGRRLDTSPREKNARANSGKSSPFTGEGGDQNPKAARGSPRPVGQFRDELEQFPDQPALGQLDNWRRRILVGDDNHYRVLHSRQMLTTAPPQSRIFSIHLTKASAC